jgi:hypothetical protein
MATLVLHRSELIDRLAQIASDYNTTPDALLDTAIQEFLDKMERRPVPTQQEQPL